MLPGVEFFDCFSSNGKERVIRDVTIFSDDNDVKIQALKMIIKESQPRYAQTYKRGNQSTASLTV